MAFHPQKALKASEIDHLFLHQKDKHSQEKSKKRKKQSANRMTKTGQIWGGRERGGDTASGSTLLSHTICSHPIWSQFITLPETTRTNKKLLQNLTMTCLVQALVTIALRVHNHIYIVQ